ncbi:hypothetical protein scyTo_0007400, partial [Scyliorhinus torazame]|nr:hypothetical protein [Scyliorhinus torazame]
NRERERSEERIRYRVQSAVSEQKKAAVKVTQGGLQGKRS